MRKINTEDVFKMARLIRKGNIVPIIKNAYAAGRKAKSQEAKSREADGETAEETAEQIGIDAFMDIMCSCTEPEIEELFYELLSGICEKSPDDIRTQSLETTIEDVKRICQENNITNFFKSASGLSEKIQE